MSCSMSLEAYHRAQALGICHRCVCLFINPKYEEVFLKDDIFISQHVAARLSLEDTPVPPAAREGYICPCCMNCFTNLHQIAEEIDRLVGAAHSSAHNQTLFLNIITPPVFETTRIACRTLVTLSPTKVAPFPCWDELLSRLIGKVLCDKGHRICSKIEDSKVKVDVVLNYHDEINMALAVDPKFEKSKKRRQQGVQLQVIDHNFSFERRDEDNLLVSIKSFTKDLKLLKYLNDRLVSYFTTLLPPPPLDSLEASTGSSDLFVEGCPLSWKLSVCTQPIYLIGRYRKLSREISQAKWTLTEENEDYDEDCDPRSKGSDDLEQKQKDSNVIGNANETFDSNDKLKSVRKGKMSVEEIVCEAVNHAMKAKISRLHPCGREDIDVRMLGNGRPFVIEVLEAKEAPTQAVMQIAMDFVSSGSGLNVDNDVDILILEETTHKTWATMQHVAEEKRKGYSCICWSANKLTPAIINHIESVPQTCGNVDSEGTPCLEITQKTPLRVLHRRSALTRTRHIYSMSAAMLNDHYFVLNVITSAGAYVKEFVHGDLGRTFPSISSVISSPTDILQLDVTWLYDSFVGNGNTSNDEVKRVKESLDQDIQKDITAASMSSTKVYKAAELSQSCLSWDELKGMKLASYAPTAILSNHSKVRYCILGTSFISGVMVDAIRASDCGEVYCVCGRTAKTLKEFSDKYDISVTYTDYNDMLNDPSVDVVYIGLPTLMHADWVINCAKAGKHVLNEKSFAITAADTRRAIDVVRHEGVFCMEAQMFRCHPILKKLMSLVHTELPVGSVQSVNATFTADIINLFNRKAGGSILDLGCYPMSLLRLLFGEPKAMTGSATLVKPEKEGDNVFDSASTAEITMESGLRATIFTSNNATHNWEFHIQCENGRISLSDLWRSDVEDAITITSVDKSGNKVEEKILMPLSQNFYTLQINTVNENIRNGNSQATSPAMSWDDSISNMVALDMWRRAIGLNYDGYE